MTTFKQSLTALLASLGILMTPAAVAGCWDGKIQCLIVTPDNDTTTFQCQAYSCGNVHSAHMGWTYPDGVSVSTSVTLSSDGQSAETETRIDKDNAFMLPSSVLRKELTCFAKAYSGQVYCGVSVPN